LLDLQGRDPEALDLEQVVAAPLEPVVAFRVAPVEVARAHPPASHRRGGLLRLLPVARARTLPPDEKAARARAFDLAARVIQELRLVAGDFAPAAPRPYVFAPVREEHVQHLGRADAVEDVETGQPLPLAVDSFGKLLARGDAELERPDR